MKIYILRHEDRTIDASFFAPLTKIGLINSKNLVLQLEKLKITTIISSPFIRTLQTVHPFSLKKKLKVNIDYGLCEILHPSIIAPKAYNVELPEYLCEHFNYNPLYEPIIKPTQLIYPEYENELIKRTKKVFAKIIEKYCKTNENILIVTHQGICKSILQIILKKEIENYDKGQLSIIFDGLKWKYCKLN